MAIIIKIIALIQMYSLISSFGSSCFTMFKWVHMLADVCGFVNALFTPNSFGGSARWGLPCLHHLPQEGIQECLPP